MATGSTKVIIAALIGNALIAVTKFIAAFLTVSSAMLPEGVHSRGYWQSSTIIVWV